MKWLKDRLRPYWHRLQSLGQPAPLQSETSKCRSRLARYCTGYGLDVGFGGDAIVPHAIRMDFPTPYARYTETSVQLGGDATDLNWFRDGSLDFVYSSHVLEDFPDTAAVIREWWRVIKPGGRLIIFCPDEQVYRRHCATTGQPYNQHHVHENFSLAFVKAALPAACQRFEIEHENPLTNVYSWELVVRKPVLGS